MMAENNRAIVGRFPAAGDGWRAIVEYETVADTGLLDVDEIATALLVHVRDGRILKSDALAIVEANDTGAISQELDIWSAVARYLNSGGDLYSLITRLGAMSYLRSSDCCDPLFNARQEGSLQPFVLVHTGLAWYLDAENGDTQRGEHVWSDGNGTCFHWIEDIKAEFEPEEELMERLGLWSMEPGEG